jgi:hypothetical protein
MGLWNKIKDKSKKTWGKVKETAVDVTKNVAKKIEDTAEKVVKWANRIKEDKALLINKISQEHSYKPTDIPSVVDIATIVSQYIKESGPVFDRIENQYIEIYSEQLITLLNLLDIGAETEMIKMKIDDDKICLKGVMKKHLNKRVNISDHEFISIIEMTIGISKNEKVNTFINKVLIESRDLFCQRLKEVLKSNHDFIRNHFKNKIDLLEKGMNASLNDLQNAETLASQDKNKKKEEILKSAFFICQCEYVINKI